jgi:hypothetical protein
MGTRLYFWLQVYACASDVQRLRIFISGGTSSPPNQVLARAATKVNHAADAAHEIIIFIQLIQSL